MRLSAEIVTASVAKMQKYVLRTAVQGRFAVMGSARPGRTGQAVLRIAWRKESSAGTISAQQTRMNRTVPWIADLIGPSVVTASAKNPTARMRLTALLTAK